MANDLAQDLASNVDEAAASRTVRLYFRLYSGEPAHLLLRAVSVVLETSYFRALDCALLGWNTSHRMLLAL